MATYLSVEEKMAIHLLIYPQYLRIYLSLYWRYFIPADTNQERHEIFVRRSKNKIFCEFAKSRRTEHVKKSCARTFQVLPRRPLASANLDDGSQPSPLLQNARCNLRRTSVDRSSALARDGREAAASAIASLPCYRRRSGAMAWGHGE